MPDAESADRVLGDLNLASVIDGKYEVVEGIARGGMSAVYLAYDRRLEREVALKFLLPGLGEQAYARVLEEARLMARVRHPNVLPIYDIGYHRGLPYLVVPYVAGEDLTVWAESLGGPPVDAGRVVAVLEEACLGLIAMHDAGVIHRDIKPGNILISTSGQVVIADLGLAHYTSARGDGTTLMGTPGYIAPEDIRREDIPRRYAFATDVYGLGVTAYWLLCGRRAFAAPTVQETLERQLSEELPAVSMQGANVHQAFDEPLWAATRADPRERLTARQLRRALLVADEARQETNPAPRHARVVLVDDDPDILALVSAIVQDALPEVEVAAFSQPARALREITARPPTLVITDLDMPGMTGASLLNAIRGEPSTAKVPVVVLTGVGSASDWLQLRRAGATKFLVKPLDSELLHHVVRRLHT